jgi:hypothetical protein
MKLQGNAKAALNAISAVIASVVVLASVAETIPPASTGTLKVAPIAAVEQPIAEQHPAAKPKLIAQATAPVVLQAPTLLPIVKEAQMHQDQEFVADTVLRKLPSLCRDNLKTFTVRYDDSKERGLGGKTTIIVSGNESYAEFAALIVHECGHVISANLMGHPRSGASAFKDGNDVFAKDSETAAFFAISWKTETKQKRGNAKEDFVTGYASSDAFEDFAETFATYVLQRASLEERAKTNASMALKLDWMKTYLPMPANTLGTASYMWDKKVPWDSTKLAYTWNP